MGETEDVPSLPEALKRFLEKMLASTRTAGVYDYAELFKRFPQKRLFEAYKDEPKSRAKLLCANSKMPFEIAVELDVAGCLQVFDIALDKLKEATPDKVFAVMTPEELVRVMDNKELWEFIEATKWYETDSEKRRTLMRELHTACKALQLGGGRTRTLHAIEDAIGLEAYVEHLPKPLLVKVFRTARDLADGKGSPKGTPFAVDALDEAVGDVLGEHLPLPILVRPIHGFAKAAGWIVDPPKAAEPPPPPVEEKKSDADADDDEKVPTIPPSRKADGDDGEPEVSVSGGGESAPPDPDDAELDALILAEEARKKAEEGREGQPLRLDEDEGDDGKTRVAPAPAAPKVPPPLPLKGQQGGQQRRR